MVLLLAREYLLELSRHHENASIRGETRGEDVFVQFAYDYGLSALFVPIYFVNIPVSVGSAYNVYYLH